MRSSALWRGLLFAVILAGTKLQAAETFSIAAEPVVGQADGPVAVRVTLTYHGREPLAIRASNLLPEEKISVSAPPEWLPQRLPGASRKRGGSIIVYQQLLQPGEQVTTTCSLDRLFRKIPAGKARLIITWPIKPILGQRIVLSTTLEMEVPLAAGASFPASPLVCPASVASPGPSLNKESPAASLPPPAPPFRGWPLVTALGAFLLLALALLLFRRRRRKVG